MDNINCYSLRASTWDDFEFVRKVHHETLREYVESIWGWDEDTQDELIKKVFKPEKFQIIQTNSQDIGVLAIRHCEFKVILDNILIVPSHQRKGLGAKIIKDVIKDASQKNLPLLLQVLKTNLLAKKLYEHLGFQTVGESKNHFHMKWSVKIEKKV